jgi:hypothetical protein
MEILLYRRIPMPANISSKEKTLKNMLAVSSSDTYTIDKILYYCRYDTEGNIIVLDNIINKYESFFNNDSLPDDDYRKLVVEFDVPQKYYYQPAAFAEYLYGTPDLDFLVLYFAKMLSMFEFTKPKIKALKPSASILTTSLFSIVNRRSIS